MGIIDTLKDFWYKIRRKDQPNLLTSGSVYNKDENSFDKRISYKVFNDPNIEECIEEFIKQYSFQEEINSKASDKPYKAFRRMFCGQEEEMGNNYKNQMKLVDMVKKRGYTIGYQSSNNKVAFLHISGQEGIKETKDLNYEKIYINCDRKNIALLTGVIWDRIRGIAGDKLQMKCICEQILEEGRESEANSLIKNYQRNDKIVIYAENHEMLEKITSIINQIKLEKPKLFSESKVNPLLPKKFGFIGVAKEEMGAHAETPVGIASGKTYNDYLSDVIYRSVCSGFDKCYRVDSGNCNQKLEERMAYYTSAYRNMTEEQKAFVLRECKDVFLDVCRQGKVNTVYTPIENNYVDISRDISVNRCE